MEKLLTRKEAAKPLASALIRWTLPGQKARFPLFSVENGCVLYGAEPSGIHRVFNAQGKTEGSQYRLNLQNPEIPGTKVTSLIEHSILRKWSYIETQGGHALCQRKRIPNFNYKRGDDCDISTTRLMSRTPMIRPSSFMGRPSKNSARRLMMPSIVLKRTPNTDQLRL